MRYEDFLKTPDWAILRQTVLIRENNRCEHCGREATEVHHKTYKHGWLCPDKYLTAICRDCHQSIHDAETAREVDRIVAERMALFDKLGPEAYRALRRKQYACTRGN